MAAGGDDRTMLRRAGSLSRGQALKALGGAIVAAIVPSLRPRPAAGRARSRCRRKHGVAEARGNCRCAATCASDLTRFGCQHDASCACYATAAGAGLCSQRIGNEPGCASDSDCPPARPVCVVNAGCTGSGQSCATPTDCHMIDPTLGCIDGRCQQTFCVAPCAMSARRPRPGAGGAGLA